MLQNLTATAKRLNKRLLYQCHSFRPTESVQAAFLCGAGKDHYFTVGGWQGDKRQARTQQQRSLKDAAHNTELFPSINLWQTSGNHMTHTYASQNS